MLQANPKSGAASAPTEADFKKLADELGKAGQALKAANEQVGIEAASAKAAKEKVADLEAKLNEVLARTSPPATVSGGATANGDATRDLAKITAERDGLKGQNSALELREKSLENEIRSQKTANASLADQLNKAGGGGDASAIEARLRKERNELKDAFNQESIKVQGLERQLASFKSGTQSGAQPVTRWGQSPGTPVSTPPSLLGVRWEDMLYGLIAGLTAMLALATILFVRQRSASGGATVVAGPGAGAGSREMGNFLGWAEREFRGRFNSLDQVQQAVVRMKSDAAGVLTSLDAQLAAVKKSNVLAIDEASDANMAVSTERLRAGSPALMLHALQSARDAYTRLKRNDDHANFERATELQAALDGAVREVRPLAGRGGADTEPMARLLLGAMKTWLRTILRSELLLATYGQTEREWSELTRALSLFQTMARGNLAAHGYHIVGHSLLSPAGGGNAKVMASDDRGLRNVRFINVAVNQAAAPLADSSTLAVDCVVFGLIDPKGSAQAPIVVLYDKQAWRVS